VLHYLLELYLSLFPLPLPLTKLVGAGNKALTHMATPDPNHVDVDVGMNQLINHLVFECLYAKFLWRTLHLVLGLRTPLIVYEIVHDHHNSQTRGATSETSRC
jgi:hypothetical protein